MTTDRRIQQKHFSNGGFVLHRAPVGRSRYSAWYDRDGRLLDAECVRGEHTYRVPERHRLVRAELARLGRRHKNIPHPTAPAE